MKATNIFPGEDCYFYEPEQVFFIDKRTMNYIEKNFEVLVEDLHQYYPEVAYSISKEKSKLNCIKLGLMCGYYWSGIAYKDEIIGTGQEIFKVSQVEYICIHAWSDEILGLLNNIPTEFIVEGLENQNDALWSLFKG